MLTRPRATTSGPSGSFSLFLGHSPDRATIEDLRRYQLHLVDQGISAISLNAAIIGLKFFFDVTLDHPAQIGVTLVLHTWGSALTHHPHVHGIVPGGGLSADGERWVTCKPGFFLPVRVLSRLFRRRFLEELSKAHGAGQLRFFGEFAGMAEAAAFADWLRPLRQCEWVVYAKRPFAGPQAVLAYLSRYTHRVAISNQRLVAMDARGISFRWKDYRSKERMRLKTMTLSPDEFMRRFLLHVLPSGFHRIRHFGLLANGGRRENLAKVRALLQVAPISQEETADASDSAILDQPTFVCPDCGAVMVVIETFGRGQQIRAPPLRQGAS